MKTMIQLNKHLISNLDDILHIPAADLKKIASFSRATYYRIKEDPSSITVQQLLSFANGLHIPVKKFFSTGETEGIGQREDYITEPFLPCYYDESVLQEVVDNKQEATWKLAAKETGITRSNLRNSLLAVTRTPVVRFLKVCNIFETDPFKVLIDPNRGTKRKNVTPNDFHILRIEINALNKKIDDLSEKYQRLLDRHNELESFINQYQGYEQSLIASEPEVEG